MKSLNTPDIILKSKSIGHPIDFKWTRKRIHQFLDPLDENIELENVLNGINHKATVGLAAALLEWIHCRFSGYTKSANDIQQRIEALWCSIDNPENTTPLFFDQNLDMPASGSVNGPIWIALMNVRMIDVRYRKGSYFIQNEIIGLVLLARYVTPKEKCFDKWFNDTIIELNRLYPSTYNYNDLDETDEAIYDSSNEPVICRDFFFNPEFEFTPENSENALTAFIENLDPKANPFLQLSQKAS
ncbi:hypothetical protein [Flavobacterium sp. JAS]|uniref:hypothetical protein n=1 Tax=Flavobacterium sp. JAS TaxID=2897329 RepID=UPI001E2B839D|nr:hypothetical protein [Flavobacterium sp. JAS]MCD0470862.1 hypothetical protein [Flavobacterium sp. JAS]